MWCQKVSTYEAFQEQCFCWRQELLSVWTSTILTFKVFYHAQTHMLKKESTICLLYNNFKMLMSFKNKKKKVFFVQMRYYKTQQHSCSGFRLYKHGERGGYECLRAVSWWKFLISHIHCRSWVSHRSPSVSYSSSTHLCVLSFVAAVFQDWFANVRTFYMKKCYIKKQTKDSRLLISLWCN